MDINNTRSEPTGEQNIIGNNVHVVFTSLNNKPITGKVDTGATTSSLHAENIQVDKNSNRVSFVCTELSNSVITMELDGSQEVVSADAGGKTRPVIKLDVEIEGVPLQSMSFNLNDRSEMNSPLLIGQNVLKAGNFVIDVNKGSEDDVEQHVSNQSDVAESRDAKIIEAIQYLTENDITLSEIIQYMRTAAVNSIKE